MGHEFRIGNAAGTAAKQGFDLLGKIFPDHHTADALRAQQALVPGESDGGGVEVFHRKG